MSYDSNSSDAMFAKIMTRLEQQDLNYEQARIRSERSDMVYRDEIRATLRNITEQVTLTNGKVRALESWRDNVNGRIMGVAVVVSGITAIATLVLQYMLIK
jgi:hypothetical protein